MELWYYNNIMKWRHGPGISCVDLTAMFRRRMSGKRGPEARVADVTAEFSHS